MGSLQVCRELRQRLVEVVHLREDTHDHDDREDVGGRVRELVVAGEGELQRDAEGLDRHDRHGADGAADGEVDERVPAPVFRRDFVNHDGREDGDYSAVEEEARLDGVVEDLVYSADLLVRRSVEDDDDRSDEADGTANLA